jgi:hypothetical protein
VKASKQRAANKMNLGDRTVSKSGGIVLLDHVLFVGKFSFCRLFLVL